MHAPAALCGANAARAPSAVRGRRCVTTAAVQTTSVPSTSAPPAPRKGGSKKKIVLIEGDSLTSTWEHRAIVGGTMALMGAQGLQGFANVHDGASAAIALGSFGAAYFMADLATGLYHWGVDNYGSAETPVVGRQIEAFTSHHKHPWTIVEREFCNNVHLVFKPMLPFAAVFAASAHWTPDSWNIWASTFMFLCAMSQQFHAWSHMKASELPAPVLWAQETGLLVSRREHGQHHRAPFEGHYCIVSGFWNKYLDKGGAPDGFFRNLEKAVYDRTGVAPRCWDEPDFDTPDYDYRPGQAAPAQDAAMQ